MRNCPKCGFSIENQATENCIKCGVIFSKIRYVELESVPIEIPKRDFVEMFKTRKSWQISAIALIALFLISATVMIYKYEEAQRLARLPKTTISPDLRYRITTTYDSAGHKQVATEELRTPTNEEERQAIIKRNKLDEKLTAEYYAAKAKHEQDVEEKRRSYLTQEARDREDEERRKQRIEDQRRIEEHRIRFGN